MYIYTGWAKNRGQTHDHIILVKSQPIYQKNFAGRFLSKFAVKEILNIPLHFAYVATLP